MARARSGGGLAAALVLFIIAFVFALIAAIVFASQKSAAVAERDAAENELRAVALPSDLAGAPRPESGGGTVVGFLVTENQQLKSMISSQPEVSAASLDEQRRAAGVELALLDEVQRLKNELAAAMRSASQAQDAATASAAQATAAEASKSELAAAYESNVTELRGQINTLQQGIDDYRRGIEGSDTALGEQMAQVRQEKDTRIAELEQQARQKDAELNRLQRLIDDMRGVDGVAAGENIVPADGHITGMADDGQIVFIDRGAAHHLILGTTFEVFNDNDLVKTDEYNQVRGKATVEVVGVDENGAQARIVRTAHRAVLRAGDKIINLVYDPNKTHRFHIYGNFDVNADNRATEAERLLVESMVRTWGGQISDTLNYEVDYLVLGAEPPLPDPLPQDVIDPVLIQRNVEQQRVYEQYQTLKGEAAAQRIPVLNQNRFLALVGYYER